MAYFLNKQNLALLNDKVHEINVEEVIELSDELAEEIIQSKAEGAEIYLVENQVVITPKKPSICHVWNGEEWLIDETKQAELKAQQQAEMWERIKEKRYQNGLGGVYVESVGKWFQTGEEEKTKYLGLDRVIDKLGKIDWKTYDNTVVKMNRTLLDEIFIAMVQAENADHLNAEYHKQQMLLADDPLTYDYSTGWSKCYEENHQES